MWLLADDRILGIIISIAAGFVLFYSAKRKGQYKLAKIAFWSCVIAGIGYGGSLGVSFFLVYGIMSSVKKYDVDISVISGISIVFAIVMFFVLGSIVYKERLKTESQTEENTTIKSTTTVSHISSELDKKNGYKNFIFGMSLQEVKRICQPDESWEEENQVIGFSFTKNYEILKVGDYNLKEIYMWFFKEKLFLIVLLYDNNQEEFMKILTHAYGEPQESDKEELRWQGDKVKLFASKNKDKKNNCYSIIFQDKYLIDEIDDYIKNKSIEASKDL